MIPAAYLCNAANKASPAASASELRAVADSLQLPLHDPDGAWARLDKDQRHELTELAQKCADLFQRSSSCVEGRNSRLGLWEHALRHVSGKKLSVLTIVQNYFAQRPEGTTAGERFFGAKPADLFEHILDKMDMPPGPDAVGEKNKAVSSNAMSRRGRSYDRGLEVHQADSHARRVDTSAPSTYAKSTNNGRAMALRSPLSALRSSLFALRSSL